MAAAGGGRWPTDVSMRAVGTALAGVAPIARQEVGELAVHCGVARQPAMAALNLDVPRGRVPHHGVGVADDRIASAVDGGESDTVRQPPPSHGERRAEGNDVAGRLGPPERDGSGHDSAHAVADDRHGPACPPGRMLGKLSQLSNEGLGPAGVAVEPRQDGSVADPSEPAPEWLQIPVAREQARQHQDGVAVAARDAPPPEHRILQEPPELRGRPPCVGGDLDERPGIHTRKRTTEASAKRRRDTLAFSSRSALV